MTSTTAKLRQSRSMRRQALFSAIAKLTGCLTFIITVASVFYVAIGQLWHSPAIAPAYQVRSTVTTAAPVTAAIPGTVADVESKRAVIESAAQRFLTAATVAEKLPLCRDAARVRPLMEDYYRRHPSGLPAVWDKLGWIVPVKEPGHRFVFAQAFLRGAEPVSLIAEELADGTFVIDWESAVRYSDIDWQDFLTQRPGQPTLFRVIASRPPASVAASTGDEVLELKHPAEKGSVYAYFNRNDPRFKPLLEQLQLRDWQDVPLTLKLCYPGPTADAKAVRIAGIDGQGWLILQNTRS
ncbi:MAG: hypothetical protein U0984_17455 [Prosthecobacter sp.]|nr:hypothetical protein [Prosthecobacter sp.]